MTNKEAEAVVKEIGRVRIQKNVKLQSFDAWFLFGITNMIYNACVLSRAQQQYMLLMLYRLKNDKYTRVQKRILKEG